MGNAQMVVYSPVHEASDEQSPGQGLARVPGDLNNKFVAILDNGWPAMGVIGEELHRIFREEYGARAVEVWKAPRAAPTADDRLSEIVQRADVVVAGLGNCGGCTTWICHDVTALRDRGVPTLVVVSPMFRHVAETTLSARGYPSQPVALVRPDVEFVPREALAEEAEGLARRVAHELVEAPSDNGGARVPAAEATQAAAARSR